ncbi:MAG: hypothetical protein ACXWIP_28370 [Burkholderiales bacterium]
MELANQPCNRALPIVVTEVKDGVVRLEQSGDHGGIAGCERIFEVTVSGSELAGTMKASAGTYNVKATKQ